MPRQRQSRRIARSARRQMLRSARPRNPVVVVREAPRNGRSRRSRGRKTRNRGQQRSGVDQILAAPVAVGTRTVTRSTVQRHNADEARLRVFQESFVTATLPKHGELLMVKKVSPGNFPGSRAERQADLYAKYWYNRLKFSMPGGADSRTTGRYILAWFDDPEIELQTDPDALINQCLGASHCINQSWWMAAEMDYARLNGNRVNKKEGLETNPSEHVQANEPYKCFQGKLVLVADGDAGVAMNLDIAVNLSYNCDLWEAVTRPVNLIDGAATTVVDLGGTAGQAWYMLANPGGALAVASGIPANATKQATAVLNNLLAATASGSFYAIHSDLVPSSAVTGGPAAFIVQTSGTIKFCHDLTTAVGATYLAGTGTAFEFGAIDSINMYRLSGSGPVGPTAKSETQLRNEAILSGNGRRPPRGGSA